MELPWTEKYRPKFLKDVIGQEKITERMTAYIKDKNIPHLLFAGPAGTGKTTTALCLAREFFGENFKDGFLELNASDERGIDVVRGKIKEFARTMPIIMDFKLIFLDEADALTNDAQQAMRRTMEQYTKTCRFILSCNYSSKIMDPIQSRCAVFRFRKIQRTAIKEYLKKILNIEQVKFTDDGINAIVEISEGDVRKSINILQSASVIGEVNEENVFNIASYAKPEQIRWILKLAIDGKFLDSRNMLDNIMLNYGIAGEDVLIQMSREIFYVEEIDDKTKMKVVDAIGECNFRLVEGANERIQIAALLAKIAILKY
ncbi:MAG: replication factor C small subunit [Candidatus Altiarchaeum hamiconexum]|uniref:Replication factor C small subunit n=1 Tax=Candidatus Altarchaeum hamiconexum TaxID=1803513 RepID=A0A8J7YR61_9ARCH|nr:replication factor C small subunit [Candidatus Altarchaeum hamiconexum]OIQ04947.1 MAG: Replication factor C small subunit [Candidatus Altarchaeum sp. CG2_30_32_3053]PIN67975.1 MAG: replication factor C small subunit [Candidatus Altarchaeum sp. CG12_big_fil_rev_8_21_14_0_65_33_22]PIV27068.1 MAG: replication factor C small subunit [Candidatus Altarchaeum sp. CG03_land_8_20_14_0_80_32_618]PIX49589.1 MAG: replication factor C small subunit [Candidatus Altarchaeum sp. CG_4_8_14_3_um_filter_33_205